MMTMSNDEIMDVVAKTIHPNTGDIVVLQFPVGTMKQKQMKEVWDSLRKMFPDNKCMMLPDNRDIHCLSESEIRSLISFLEETLQNG